MTNTFDSEYIYKKESKGVSLVVFLIIAIVGISAVGFFQQSNIVGAKQFTSYQELSNFIKDRTESYGGFFGATLGAGEFSRVATTQSPSAQEAAMGTTEPDYSQTNVQVEGVDEPDIVKTDGKYIYTASNSKLSIVEAYPTENAKIVGEIDIKNGAREIFVNDDKLVIFNTKYDYVYATGMAETATSSYDYYPSYEPTTSIMIYDISDRSNPTLEKNISLSGNYFDARMIDDYIYVVSTQYIDMGGEGPILPMYAVGSSSKELSAGDISYFDVYDTSFVYTNILSMNVKSDKDPVVKSYLTGSTQDLYVSNDNIYITYAKYMSYKEVYKRIIEKAYLPNLPVNIQLDIMKIQNQNLTEYEKYDKISQIIYDYAESLGPEKGAELFQKIENSTQKVYSDISKESTKTFIHKIAISNGGINYKTSANVPGTVLNQFSMDEYNGNFRIATTTGSGQNSLNHVYVLNSNMNVIGKLEDLALSEQIYSARFLGDRAYLVTFRRTDPLFVIDLSNPMLPRVAGELKITGFSEYLHPYDETHLIGVGMETNEDGRSTGQMKIGLFDVSDASNPKEMYRYLIGESGDYVYSEALYDHKAFLFSKTKNLLVIPVNINNWKAREYDQGAYVFGLTLENGFDFKGMVTHQTVETNETYYRDYYSTVRRSLYIENVLYTISDTLIKANSLTDLSLLAEVNLNNS